LKQGAIGGCSRYRLGATIKDTIGALTRRRLSKIAHSAPGVTIVPMRNRAGGDDRFWPWAEVRGSGAESLILEYRWTDREFLLAVGVLGPADCRR
jgi:hypothetical protein